MPCWLSRAQLKRTPQSTVGSLGVGVTTRITDSSHTGNGADVGFEMRIGHERPGWGADYQARTAGRNLRADASNAFSLKPEVQIWYDVSRRFGLRLNGGFLLARPSITISSTLGDDSRSVRADVFLATAGVVYSVF